MFRPKYKGVFTDIVVDNCSPGNLGQNRQSANYSNRRFEHGVPYNRGCRRRIPKSQKGKVKSPWALRGLVAAFRSLPRRDRY